jgi:hypothetical protein
MTGVRTHGQPERHGRLHGPCTAPREFVPADIHLDVARRLVPVDRARVERDGGVRRQIVRAATVADQASREHRLDPDGGHGRPDELRVVEAAGEEGLVVLLDEVRDAGIPRLLVTAQ